MQPPQPVQMPQPPENKRMSVPQIMLIVLVLAFAIWYLVTTLTPESSPYATISAGVIGSRYTGDCLIVRDESPFDAEGVSSVDYIAEEGTLVARGTVVCNVYSSGFSTREMTALQDYRDQIKEYQIKLLKQQVTTDARMEKLEADVMTRAREVRELIGGARGNMNNQEALLSAAIQARQARLKEMYSEDQRMTRLYDDEQSQLQRISSWTKQYGAQSEGLVSANDQYAKGKTTIYRLVRDGHWIVLMLIKDSNWNPVEGATYELKLENFKDTMVQARVLSFTRTGGELLVRLDVISSVKPILYIRTCTGVLGDSVSSLCVPNKALYTQDGMPGVVVVREGYQFFVPVNVVDKRDGMVYIAPIQQDSIYEGETVRLF